jgi:hypothetical protein
MIEQSKVQRAAHFLKPFFNLRVENVQDAVSLLLGVAVFAVIVFQALFMDMTYDEAYTYLNTGRIQDVWKVYQFRIANTHLLNSLLMALTTLFFPYNDFAIRLPSVLISAFYITTAISFSKTVKNRLIFLGLLLLFYFVIEYFAMARGYGMSAAFILAAVFVYKNQEKFPAPHLVLSALFLLAIYANYVAIPFVLVMGAYIYAIDYRFQFPQMTSRSKKWIIGLFVLSIYGFFSVTRAGKPLYGAYNKNFFEAIPLDYFSRFIGDLDFTSIYVNGVTIAIIGLILFVYIVSSGKNVVGVVTLGTFALILVLAWIGDKPLPTGRVLIPFWPLIVISLVEILEWFTFNFRIPKVVYVGVNGSVFAVLLWNFWPQIPIKERIESKSHQWEKPVEVMANYGKEPEPHEIYYLEKDQYHHDLLKHLENRNIQPDEIVPFSEGVVEKYDGFGFALLKLDKNPEGNSIRRKVFNGQEMVFEDVVSLSKNVYSRDGKWMVICAYPNLISNQLLLEDTNHNWSFSFSYSL